MTIDASGTCYAALAGASVQLPVVNTVALAEYYYISEGLSADDLAAVYGALRSPDAQVQTASSAWYAELARRPGRQGRDYLFASLSQPTFTDSGDPVFDYIGLSATCLLNLEDASFYLSGDLALTFVKNSSVDLTVAWAQGGSESEFGNAPTRLCLGLEVRVFF